MIRGSKLIKKKLKKNNASMNFSLFMIALPGLIWLFVFRYLPMFGIIVAFKRFRIHRGGFIVSLFKSKWIGFKNFSFLFNSSDAFVITRNVLGYNIAWLVINLVLAVTLAIILNELRSKKITKIYQTSMIFPHFISWVIAGYFVWAFLSTDMGFINRVLMRIGAEPIMWYTEKKYWPFILTIMNVWKHVGYSAIFYLAAICGIDPQYYEAAKIDGAKKIQQIWYITLPMLAPVMIILTLLAIGRIFYADFGLFYHIPRESGPLLPVTNVIDTYVYRGVRHAGEIGLTSAAGFYQSTVGFILVMVSNMVIKKISPDNALF